MKFISGYYNKTGNILNNSINNAAITLLDDGKFDIISTVA